MCRYIPSTGDDVVGVVLERHAENFVVDIGAPFPAVLNSLAFEGATRRNRPKLAEGDLVYARVVLAHQDIDTEVSCTDSGGKVCTLNQIHPGIEMHIFERIRFGNLRYICCVCIGFRIWTFERRKPCSVHHGAC